MPACIFAYLIDYLRLQLHRNAPCIINDEGVSHADLQILGFVPIEHDAPSFYLIVSTLIRSLNLHSDLVIDVLLEYEGASPYALDGDLAEVEVQLIELDGDHLQKGLHGWSQEVSKRDGKLGLV